MNSFIATMLLSCMKHILEEITLNRQKFEAIAATSQLQSLLETSTSDQIYCKCKREDNYKTLTVRQSATYIA